MRTLLVRGSIAFCFLAVLMGCQKNPSNQVIIGKDTEQMIETAKSSSNELLTEGSASINMYELLDAPLAYSAELFSKKGQLKVSVEANVLVPEYQMPIVRIRSVDFEPEQIKKFANVYFNGAKFVRGFETPTYAYYIKKIEELRTAINNWEEAGAQIYDMAYETKQEAVIAMEDMIQKAASAPKVLDEIIPDFSLKRSASSLDSETGEPEDSYLSLWAMPDDGTFSAIYVSNNRMSAGTAEMWYTRDNTKQIEPFSSETNNIDEYLSISQSEAYNIADESIRNLGLENFVCVGEQTVLHNKNELRIGTVAAYAFMFTRQINGISETYTNDNVARDASYSKPWQYEKIYVLVDDDGVLYANYSGPIEVVEFVASASELLSFKDIQTIFEKMIVIVDNMADTGIWGNSTEEYVITEIRLGLVSIRETNMDSGLLIPAWDFLGYSKHFDATTGRSYVTKTNRYEPFLTINAIDGSIIQRGNGY